MRSFYSHHEADRKQSRLYFIVATHPGEERRSSKEGCRMREPVCSHFSRKELIREKFLFGVHTVRYMVGGGRTWTSVEMSYAILPSQGETQPCMMKITPITLTRVQTQFTSLTGARAVTPGLPRGIPGRGKRSRWPAAVMRG